MNKILFLKVGQAYNTNIGSYFVKLLRWEWHKIEVKTGHELRWLGVGCLKQFVLAQEDNQMSGCLFIFKCESLSLPLKRSLNEFHLKRFLLSLTFH